MPLRVRIDSPCDASWELMDGDDRVRRCARCERDVHDLATHSLAEARAAIASGACLRVTAHADGTVVTRESLVRRLGLVAVLLLSAGLALATRAPRLDPDGHAFESPLVERALEILRGQPRPTPHPRLGR